MVHIQRKEILRLFKYFQFLNFGNNIFGLVMQNFHFPQITKFDPFTNNLSINILILILIFLNFLPIILSSYLIHLLHTISLRKQPNYINYQNNKYTCIVHKNNDKTNPAKQAKPFYYFYYLIWVV